MRFRERTHIWAVAATLMRGSSSITRASEKRGGGVSVTSLDDQQIAATSDVDILALDEALDPLAAMDARQSQIVELRFSGGLTIEETAKYSV